MFEHDFGHPGRGGAPRVHRPRAKGCTIERRSVAESRGQVAATAA